VRSEGQKEIDAWCAAWPAETASSLSGSTSDGEMMKHCVGSMYSHPAPVLDTILEVDDVCRHYAMGGETIAALDGVNFRITRGEYVAIVGRSGSGKSTLMNVLGCLDQPTKGRYRLGGQDVQALSDDALSELRNRHIGFVFQNFQLLPRASALTNVALPLLYRGVARRERDARARAALERVGLGERLKHRPNELSGGQRQRVAIARALVGDPSLLLADEPCGNLDSSTGASILALFDELHRSGNTIVMVTHEPDIAAQCPRVIQLANGRVVSDGPGREVPP
jgi:putative ABC transport system ATP-binding protein